MTWQVQVRPEAELDTLLAARWYEGQRTGLGSKFIEEIGRLVVSLSDNALLYPRRSSGLRRAASRRFPYAVYFRLEGSVVVVVSVLHMRRDQPNL